MSTPCRHDNRRNLRVWANRLILSRLDDNDDVPDMIAAEIADCPGCRRQDPRLHREGRGHRATALRGTEGRTADAAAPGP